MLTGALPIRLPAFSTKARQAGYLIVRSFGLYIVSGGEYAECPASASVLIRAALGLIALETPRNTAQTVSVITISRSQIIERDIME